MKRFALLACTLALAACSSSGGGDDNNSKNSSNNTATTPSQTATQNNTVAKNTASSVNTQFYASKNASNTAVTFPDSSAVSKIKVDGTEFDLTKIGGFTLNGDWEGKYGNSIVSGTSNVPSSISHIINYKGSPNFVVGLLTSTATGTNYAYYNGKFTDASQVPTSGRVNYEVSGTKFEGSSQTSSRGTLVADFGAKTLTGTLQNLALKANINGSRFASENGAAVEVKGGFFGQNAEEIGGIYKSGSAVGAFAGDKQ